jgi:hypothetical protein
MHCVDLIVEVTVNARLFPVEQSLLMRESRFSTWPSLRPAASYSGPNGAHRNRKARRLIADDEGSGDGKRNDQSGADNDVGASC